MKGARASGDRVRPAVGLIMGLPFLASTVLVASEGPRRAPRYGVGDWNPESGLGNHRAVVRVEAPKTPGPANPARASRCPENASGSALPLAARVRIEWRRRDPEPEKKNVLVVDAATGRRVTEVHPIRVDREKGEFVFVPPTVPGDYHFYYLPYKSEGRKNYPNVKYDPAEWSTDPGLAARAAGLSSNDPAETSKASEGLLEAEVVAFESAEAFSAFTPMEWIASWAEIQALLNAHPEADYLLFPEDRSLSIRMTDDIPRHWAEDGPLGTVRGLAARGEYFTFQIGVWAARRAIADLDIRFSDLVQEATDGVRDPSSERTVIPASAATCLNKEGVGWDGKPFVKPVRVERGKVQALWCGLQVPRDARPGVYHGTVTLAPEGSPMTALAVELQVNEETLEDHGDSDPHRLTRLRWLDSTLAQDDGIVPPYTPLAVDGRTVSCLGRSLTIGKDGLPARIRSSFAPEMTGIGAAPVELLASAFKLRVHDGEKRELGWTPSAPGPRWIKRAEGAVEWEAESRAEGLTMKVLGRMEFDGFVGYQVALTADRDMDVSDIWLEVPFREESARYMMGLGFKGGVRPERFDWSWDRTKNQDALWLGAVNAGMQISWRAENYSRPLNTNFYLSKPLDMPPSWWNEGRGAVALRTVDQGKTSRDAGATSGGSTLKDERAGRRVVVLSAHSDLRTIKAGQTLHFDFTLLLTPFKPLAPGRHFKERYVHAFKPVDEVAEMGANVINVHHANAINPYINYPFLRVPEMKAYIDEAHRLGFKVKIYNTIRELSNRAPELFALRSLGHEIFSPGEGGGYSWLQEHLGGDYIAAWFVPELRDAAIINSGMSRWHNYYIEGLNWLARNVGLDGLYIDDVAFDRTTMKRVRKVLDRNREGALIDLHSANQYNVRDGFASSANLYLEHFPYLDRLWFGEYFDYEGSDPAYWLVELSGIPFGLMGEMLEKGGNPWRGMVFGMTSRLPWAGDPRPLWKVWDEFGIAESEMIGWWAERGPVRTGRPDVLATCYVRRDQGAAKSGAGDAEGNRTMIALASWAKEEVEVRLRIDWKGLGLDPAKAVLRAPAIESFQEAAEYKPGDPVRLAPGKGLLLVIR